MLVTLVGKNVIHKLILPKMKMGNYWLTDKSKPKERKLINIEGTNGKWQIVSNDYAKIVRLETLEKQEKQRYPSNIQNLDPGEIVNKIFLQEYDMYGVYLQGEREPFILYCSPVQDRFFRLQMNGKKEWYIGKNPSSAIFYKNQLIANTQARVFYSENHWKIENLDSQVGTFVNNRIIEGKDKVLFNGDVVFIMGLKFILLGNTLFINNPLQQVTCNKEYFSAYKEIPNTIIESNEEEKNLEVFSEEDYFSKAPRITNLIEKEKVKIDAPPQIQDKEEMPMILALGSSLSMGVMMLFSIMNTIQGKANGTATKQQIFFSLATSAAMMISMIAFPIATLKYNRRKKKKYEQKRQKRYKEYLNKKQEEIQNIIKKQRNILFENYVSAEECTRIIMSQSGRLWERNIDSYDFLTIRLGTGDVPLNIDIQYPEEKFSMEDDNLIEMLNNIVRNSKTIHNAPITTSLIESNITAIIAPEKQRIRRFIQSLIIQLIAFQSYEDLKLVFFLKEDRFHEWDYVKMLPHVWNNTKEVRFWADDYDEMTVISRYLEEDLKERREYKDKDYKSFKPYYVIITDDYKKIENLKIITEIQKAKTNMGFSILCITNDFMQLPNECKTFIQMDGEKGTIFENEVSSTNRKEIIFDNSIIIFFEKICQTMLNIPIRYTAAGSNLLPNSYTFLEMYDVGRIEQLNVLDRWNRNDPTLSLKAPIGIDANKMPIVLDIHEKFHGPHGLIAGSTGSGKSEFIITYILSLSINYHPDDINFILIDYKGGGLAGAFKKGNIQLPHLVGTITNIDTNGLQRSLTSIQSELRRRQVIFNEARNNIEGGTIDIYKYQKLYKNGIVKNPIPHLLIICDEFAELKQQQPEFMDELMSVSRIGRSLGVHLILATQKPAGIVNEQIRGNSKFAICLKVQDKSDSMDVIKKPDAANLKYVGQFYMQVGNDEYSVLGQSAWAGAPYIPKDIVEKKVDNSVEFVSNIGLTIEQADDAVQKTENDQGEQLTNIVRHLYELAKQKGIKTKKLWLDEIPEEIYIDELKEKYKVRPQNYTINPIIGEYDDPYNQAQGIVGLELSSQGNTVIYGNAESGKETLLSTMIYDLICTHTVDEVQLYLLDFGTETLKVYKDAPQVGDVVFINDTEKISRFFAMLQKEIEYRKRELSNYNGDYMLYLKNSGKAMPMIIVTMNNYESFAEMYESQYDDIFLSITRECIKFGIVFVITTSTVSDMRYRLQQNFKQKITLQLNREDDYYNVFDTVSKKRPASIFGRGLVKLNKNIYEFQTAKICRPEEYNIRIREKIQEQLQKNPSKAKPIPVIPEKVTFEYVQRYLIGLRVVPIGIVKKNLQVLSYNFKKNYVTMISSNNIADAAQFVANIIEQMKILKNVELQIFDAEHILKTQKTNIQEEYTQFISNIHENPSQEILCIIIGVDKFLNDFETLQNTFDKTLKDSAVSEKCNFILVENANKFKSHEYNDWFKNYISKDTGIWVGNGIDNQYLMTINSNRRELINNCGRSYGYSINQGIATLVKLLEMKENGDSNE